MEKKSSSINDEIDIPYFFKIIKKSKILIIFVSIIFTLLGYLYQSYQPRELQLQFKIRPASIAFFTKHLSEYENNINFNNGLQRIFYDQYNDGFISNLLSLENFEEFVSQNTKIDNFKNFLKLKNISAKEYFFNKLTLIPSPKNIDDKYFLNFRFIFLKELDGSVFISDYAEFIKNKTLNEYKHSLQLLFEDYDIKLNNALELAKAASIEDPIFSKVDINVNTQKNLLFYEGTKVLSTKIILHKKNIQDLDNIKFNYNVILEKTPSKQFSKSEYSYALAGFIFGIFLSIIIIFFKKYN
jgi:LPS O-antigen subunit length determinant protein (WzzB/FepE family)